MKGLKKVFLLLVIILTVTFQINYITVSCEESEIDEYSNYKLLPISVKQVNNDTVLDNDGKVWCVMVAGMEMGHRLESPVEIPGMVNAVLIGDRISLLSNGAIWSWEIMNQDPHNEPIIEHQLGVLPDNLAVSDVVKIFKYDDFIFIIDNKGILYYVYNYDKKIETGCNNLEVTQLLENVKDIGYGYILENNGKVHWFDIETENNKVTIKLNFVMDNIKQLVSGEYKSLCLDNDGKVFELESVETHINQKDSSIPVNITDIPLMSKLFDTSQPTFFSLIGEDVDGNLIGARPCYTEDGDYMEVRKIIIYDYKDIVVLDFRHIIVIKNDNTAKDWFTDNSIYNFIYISPEDLNNKK